MSYPPLPKLIGASLGTFLCLFTLGYTYFRTKDLIAGPVLTITTPMVATVHDSLTEISGTVKNAKQISVNDRTIFINEQGEFHEKLLLAEGYNIINVKAEDRFKRVIQKKLELVFIN